MKAKLFFAMMYSRRAIYEEAKRFLELKLGSIEAESNPYTFNFTDYYTKEMGANLEKRFVVFKDLIEREKLPKIKLLSMKIEKEMSKNGKRLINIDPGYITPHAIFLATRKDRAHRVYMGQGIFIEVTLLFTKDGCKYFEWTYPDYKLPENCDFFRRIREGLLRAQRQK